MTDIQKKAADIIVQAYKDKKGNPHNIHGLLSNLKDKAPLDALRYASHILLSKDILMAIDGVNRENLMLSDKGWEYESFDKLIEEEKRKQNLEDALIISSINSNKSSTKVNNLFWLTFFVASFAVLIQLFSYFNDREKHDLQRQVQSQDTLIQSLHKQLLQEETVPNHQRKEKTSSKMDTFHY